MRRFAAMLFVVLVIAVAAVSVSRCGRGDTRAPATADGTPAADAAPVNAVEDEPRRERVRVAPDEAEETAETVAIADEAWVVRVVDGAGRPVAGAAVSVRGTFAIDRRFTDAGGEVVFAAKPSHVETPLLEGRTEVASELTILTVVELRPVEVRVVDLETGAPLEVEWWEDDGESPNRSDRTVAWARPGGPVRADLRFSPPSGWVWPDGAADRGLACVHAERYVAVVPVPREAKLRVTVSNEDGSRTTGGSVRAYVRGDRFWPWPEALVFHGGGAADEQGVATLRGLPLIRGEKVMLHAAAPPPPDAPDGDEDVWAEGRAGPLLLTSADRMHEASVVVSTISDSNESPFEGPGIGGPIGIGGSGKPIAGAARLTVHASTRGGRPARGATIRLRGPTWDAEVADEDGRATFGAVPPGDYAVWLDQPGLVATSATVTLAPQEQATLALREAPGRDVRVRVVDARGRPLPHAVVMVDVTDGWCSYAHIVGGTQTLAPMTDGDGRIALVGLASNGVRVRAWFGSRWTDYAPADGDAVELKMPDAH